LEYNEEEMEAINAIPALNGQTPLSKGSTGGTTAAPNGTTTTPMGASTNQECSADTAIKWAISRRIATKKET
jgi:hypothetical protein